MAGRLVTPPSSEPVGVDESRQWARIDDDVDEGIVALAIKAAREHAEHITGRRFVTQAWALRVRAGQTVALHGFVPVQSVKTAAGDDLPWFDDGIPPTVTAVADGELRITCGYGDANVVPSSVKMWIWQRLGFYIENRDSLISGKVVAPPRDYVDGLLDGLEVPRL
ncbi:hypothetical protein PAP18089_01910 [Pandoraea apista]|uniref:Uncharacterized protein n=1 Tax=Pandoraea apista TaxID=93218 RepID=A0A5E5P2W1_9BURK|nr:hypothetical protein [Pandoraea apista]VVG70938.1 hypothetical protein PAP18089_01910 [Pandoraea apista]